MKITFKNTPEQVALIKAMASRNKMESLEAQEAFAAFISPVVQEVLMQAGTSRAIYEDFTFDEDDDPSMPVDVLQDSPEGDISVWHQTVGGGLPTNFVAGQKEIKLSTYELDSAISFERRYAQRARLNVVSRWIEKMVNEILVKQERNAWAVICKLLADAATNGNNHVIRSTTSGVLQLDDFNKQLILADRINTAYTGGTPEGPDNRGVTDLYMSPENVAQVRAFAYNPQNTRQVVATSGASAMPLPDDVRSGIYRNAGASEIFGIMIHKLRELGENKRYNDLFGAFAGSKTFDVYGGASGSAFDTDADDLVIGIDASRRAFLRPVAVQAETGGQIVTLPDDQFLSRSRKIGFYSILEEGRVATDKRAATGLIV